MSYKIPESDVEQWVEDNIRSILGEDAKIVDRQHTLPSGRRLDLLAVTTLPSGYKRFWVLEIKAVRAGADAVCQLVEYVAEVAGIDRGGSLFLPNRGGVRGVLVAPEFSTRAARLISGISNIGLVEFGVSLGILRNDSGNHIEFSDEAVERWETWNETYDDAVAVDEHFRRKRKRSMALAPLSTIPHQWRGLTLVNGGRDG